MNDVDEWLAETADLAQRLVDTDAELRDQVNFLLQQSKTPSCIRQLKNLAYSDAILAIVVSRPPGSTVEPS